MVTFYRLLLVMFAISCGIKDGSSSESKCFWCSAASETEKTLAQQVELTIEKIEKAATGWVYGNYRLVVFTHFYDLYKLLQTEQERDLIDSEIRSKIRLVYRNFRGDWPPTQIWVAPLDEPRGFSEAFSHYSEMDRFFSEF